MLLAGATVHDQPQPADGVGHADDRGRRPATPIGLANGVLQVINVLLGTYTITETVAPPGYALDDDPTAVVIVTAGRVERGDRRAGKRRSGRHRRVRLPQQVSAGQHRLGEAGRRRCCWPGRTFKISPNPTDGVGMLTIVVNGPAMPIPRWANMLVNNVLLGTYTITETVAPPGYAIDDDPTRIRVRDGGRVERR